VNEIQNFLIDAWNDLRARRLLPVAAVLVAGLVAAPIVLSKKSEDTAPPAPVPSDTQANNGSSTADELAKVKLSDDLTSGSGSSLSAFDAKDPFKPPSGVKTGNQQAQPGEVAGGGASTPPQTGTGDTGGGTGGGTGDTGGGTGGGTDTTPKTTEFTYVLDVTFWRNGHRRTIKGMQKLDVLPNQVNPLLIFMGASSGGGEGVFLVDSTLAASGEGTCKPSDDQCGFLSLGAGSEEEFTDEDGNAYRLRIDEIRKVELHSSSGSDGSANASRKSRSARAAVAGPSGGRRFQMPDLADLVVLTSTDSSGDDKRR
jgi:hypothetical protein